MKKNKFLLSILFIIFLITFIYCAFWLTTSQNIKKQMVHWFDQNNQFAPIQYQNIKANGFPWRFNFDVYDARYIDKTISLTTKKLTLSMNVDFVIKPLTIGIYAANLLINNTSIDDINAQFEITPHLPKSFYLEDIQTWREESGLVEIKNFSFQRQISQVDITGNIGLDPQNQPLFNGYIQIKNAQDLIDDIGAMINIKQDKMNIAKTVTRSFERNNLLKIFISIRNQFIFAGPMPFFPLNRVKWSQKNTNNTNIEIQQNVP